MHVCVEDCTRLAYVEALADKKADTVIAFLQRAVAHLAEHGVIVKRLMTHNGSAYRSHAHAAACLALEIRHLFTQPYRPKTNGKQSASSAPCSPSGPTPPPTPPAAHASERCPPS